jgi:predicted secreted protein
MASFSGKNGVVTIASTDFSAGGSLCVQSFTVNLDLGIEQFSCMGASNNWKSALAGMKSWDATIEASLDSAAGADVTNIAALSAAVAVALDSTDGLSFTGNAFVSSLSATVNAEGRNTLTINLLGDGALSEA